MNLPTDTELEKRALEIALGDFDDYGSSEGLAGICAATLEALKIDRESYRLLMELTQRCPFTYMGHTVAQEAEDHLTTLRKRLGITE